MKALAFALALILIPTERASAATTLPIDTWAQYQYESDHNAVFDSPDWSVSWRSQPAQDTIHGGLAVVGTTLYFVSYDHNVYAVNALTGKEIWHQTLRGIVMNTPLVTGGFVFAGTGSGPGPPPAGLGIPLDGSPRGDSVYALDAATGAIAWKFDTIGHDMPTGVLSLAPGAPEFIFTGGHARIYGLNVANGSLLWQQPAFGIDRMSSLAAYEGLIVGSSGRKAHDQSAYFRYGARINRMASVRTWAIDSSGKLQWTSNFGDVGCSPTVAAGEVFMESWSSDVPLWYSVASQYSGNLSQDFSEGYYLPIGHNEVSALDASNGRTLWTHRFAGGQPTAGGSHMWTVAAVYADHVLFESSPAAKVFSAFDARSGRTIWSVNTTRSVKMSAVVRDGIVYFGDDGDTLYLVRATDGHILQRVRFPGPFWISPPLIVGRTLFVANGNSVYAVPLKNLQRGIGPA